MREADTVRVELFDFFSEPFSHPLGKITLALSSPHVQVAGARIQLSQQLKGLQWIMNEWFYTSASIGISFILSLEVLLIAIM